MEQSEELQQLKAAIKRTKVTKQQNEEQLRTLDASHQEELAEAAIKDTPVNVQAYAKSSQRLNAAVYTATRTLEALSERYDPLLKEYLQQQAQHEAEKRRQEEADLTRRVDLRISQIKETVTHELATLGALLNLKHGNRTQRSLMGLSAEIGQEKFNAAFSITSRQPMTTLLGEE